jgi:seryl-tRNA synthetase
MNDPWITLDWEGQRIYLPEYTRTFRAIEKRIVEFLDSIEFQECLFTKLPTIKQSRVLQDALPRLSEEWSSEIVTANNDSSNPLYPTTYNLSHWQCEPFYFYLQKTKPTSTIKFYDRSGWSYRIEPDINDYRLFEFQRVEAVWFAQAQTAEEIQITLINGLQKILQSMGIQVKVEKKWDEEIQSREKSVLDLTAEVRDAGTVELVGSHLHGRLFIESLNMKVDDGYYTGCCGIGLSRIANLIIRQSLQGNL